MNSVQTVQCFYNYDKTKSEKQIIILKPNHEFLSWKLPSTEIELKENAPSIPNSYKLFSDHYMKSIKPKTSKSRKISAEIDRAWKNADIEVHVIYNELATRLKLNRNADNPSPYVFNYAPRILEGLLGYLDTYGEDLDLLSGLREEMDLPKWNDFRIEYKDYLCTDLARFDMIENIKEGDFGIRLILQDKILRESLHLLGDSVLLDALQKQEQLEHLLAWRHQFLECILQMLSDCSLVGLLYSPNFYAQFDSKIPLSAYFASTNNNRNNHLPLSAYFASISNNRNNEDTHLDTIFYSYENFTDEDLYLFENIIKLNASALSIWPRLNKNRLDYTISNHNNKWNDPVWTLKGPRWNQDLLDYTISSDHGSDSSSDSEVEPTRAETGEKRLLFQTALECGERVDVTENLYFDNICSSQMNKLRYPGLNVYSSSGLSSKVKDYSKDSHSGLYTAEEIWNLSRYVSGSPSSIRMNKHITDDLIPSRHVPDSFLYSKVEPIQDNAQKCTPKSANSKSQQHCNGLAKKEEERKQ